MTYSGQYLGQYLGQHLGQDFASHFQKARFADIDYTNASPVYTSWNQKVTAFAGGVKPIINYLGKNFIQAEAAAESLLPYCDKYDEANWNTNELTLADAAVTTPHADLDGWTLTPTAVSDVHSMYDTYNVDGASQYCWSAIVEANGYDFVMLRLGEAGFVGSPFAYFNLSTGAMGNTGGMDTYGIEDMGGGRYLIYGSALSDAAADGEPLIAVCAADYNLYTPTSYSGDTTSGIICSHVQLETGFYPSSIIETAAAAVTRAKGQLVWASANVPNALRGKITVDIIPYWPHTRAVDSYICTFQASGASDQIRVYYKESINRIRVFNATGAAILVDSNALTLSRNQILTATLDPAAGSITVDGASSGDGTVVGTAWGTSAGNVIWGANNGIAAQFDGLISEPY